VQFGVEPPGRDDVVAAQQFLDARQGLFTRRRAFGSHHHEAAVLRQLEQRGRFPQAGAVAELAVEQAVEQGRAQLAVVPGAVGAGAAVRVGGSFGEIVGDGPDVGRRAQQRVLLAGVRVLDEQLPDEASADAVGRKKRRQGYSGFGTAGAGRARCLGADVGFACEPAEDVEQVVPAGFAQIVGRDGVTLAVERLLRSYPIGHPQRELVDAWQQHPAEVAHHGVDGRGRHGRSISRGRCARALRAGERLVPATIALAASCGRRLSGQPVNFTIWGTP
jgi:hypothetical protein